MDSLMSSLESLLSAMQMPAGVCAAIAFVIGGYQLLLGGDQGRQKSVKWFIGAAVGLVIILGATALSELVSENIKF